MKKIFNVLAFAIVAFFFNSCEKNGSLDEPKTYTVSFAMSGDLSISQEPMTKGGFEEGDIIGIMAYVKNENGLYSQYEYGVFDDISKATITLVDGKKYKFEAYIEKNGVQNSLLDKNNYGSYYNFSSKITNKFVSRPTSPWRAYMNFPSLFIENYYGETIDVVPSENLVVNLEMDAVYASIKFNVEWDESITEGDLAVSISGISPSSFNLTYPNTAYSSVINITNHPETIFYDKVLMNASVRVEYTKEDGTKIPVVENKSFRIRKKTITTINLKIKASTADATVAVSIDDNPEMVDGETIDLDTTAGTDDAQIGTN